MSEAVTVRSLIMVTSVVSEESLARDRQTDRQTERETDRQIDRQADRQTDRQAGRQAGRQGDIQTLASSIFNFFKCCAVLRLVCPTPDVCIRTHENDHVRTLKILKSMSEFGGLHKHEKTQHSVKRGRIKSAC